MSRRARPTLRTLREDLVSDWEDPFVLRAVETGAVSSVQPLNDLPHPILQKASESFGDDPSQDNYIGAIASVDSEVLLEIKHGQWRAGVWVGDDACWVIAAGLAKGDHGDRDDFYKWLERIEEKDSIPSLLPDTHDRALLKRERADALVSAWQLRNQEQLLESISAALKSGTSSVTIETPLPDAPAHEVFANIVLTVAVHTEPDYSYEDVVVEINLSDRWKNSRLAWPFITHTLGAISPPEQGWDVGGGIYSNLLEIGSLSNRVEELRELTSRRQIATTSRGTTSHHAHRRNLAEKAVDGRARRALCGVYFVPRQDAEALEVCSKCAALYKEIPRE